MKLLLLAALALGAVRIQAPPPPTVSITGVTQVEGNAGTSTFDFIVSLSSSTGVDVTVNYDTLDGTAIAGVDYVGVPTPGTGVLVIPMGNTSGVISITVNGNTVIEPYKWFQVELTGATNGYVSGTFGTATGMIVNDDFELNRGCGALGLELVLSLALASALRRARARRAAPGAP